MADHHGSLLNFEEEYSKEVSFYIGGSNISAGLSSPSPEVNPKDQEKEHKITAPSSNTNKAKSGEGTVSQSKVVRQSSSKSKLTRTSAVNGPEDCDISSDVTVSVSSHGSSTTGTEQSSGNSLSSCDDIMKLYHEREKSFAEEILKLSPTMIEGNVQDRLRSRSRTPGHQSPSISVGLDHLDNLVRLMEQLSNLKEENSSLKRKCAYLEDAKSLLQARNEILRQDHRYHSSRSSRKGKGKSVHHLSTKSASTHGRRHCTSDSSDAHGNGEPIVMAGKLQHRSQSVGSIEVDNVDIELIAPGEKYMRSKSAEKAPRDSAMRPDHGSFAKLTSKKKKVPTATLR